VILLTGVLFFFLLTLVPYHVYHSGQLHYFLYALHQNHPDLFARDWLVTQTANPHPFFSAFIAFFEASGHLTPALFGIRLLQLLLLVWGLLRLSGLFSKDRRSAVLLFCFLLFYFSDGLGQETLYSSIVQPADLGKLFFLFSLTFLLEGKLAATGAFLGLTALFDFLSGVEGFILLVIFWLFGERKKTVWQMAAGLFLFLLLASPNLVPLLGNFSFHESAPAADFQKLFFNFRGPHHYRITNFELAHVFRVLFPLYFLFFTSAGVEDERIRKKIRLYATLLLSLCALAIVSMEWIYLPSLVQFRFLRLSPFLLILGLAALATMLIHETTRGGRIGILLSAVTIASLFLEKDARIFLPIAAVLVLAWSFRRMAIVSLATVSILGLYLFRGRGWEFVFDFSLGLGLTLLLRLKPSKGSAQAFWALFFLGLPALGFQAIFPNRISFHPIQLAPPSPLFQDNAELREVLEWIRKHTPREAVLLTPPDQDGIRFFSERSIVVDFHANPYGAREVWEWKKRLEAVSGLAELEKWNPTGGNTNAQRESLRKGYLKLTASGVESLAGRYGANYFLTEASYAERKSLLERRHRLVFQNARYLVFQIVPTSAQLEPSP